jgi:hypothetical protein
LITKLLEQQSKEKDLAYHQWRAQKCKVMTYVNKFKTATSAAVKKEYANAKIDTTKREQSKNAKAGRLLEKEQRKREIRDLRRAEKAKKRELHVEICSEVVDLIMDIADEAWDLMDDSEFEGKRETVDKPKWRFWLDIFTQGKKVSEIGIVNLDDEP